MLAALVMMGQHWSSLRGALFISPSEYRTTPGLILTSRVKMYTGKGTTYGYVITYQYKVNNKLFRSSQVTFSTKFRS